MSRGKLSEITLFGVNKHIFGYQSDALRLLLSVVRHLLDHFSLFTMSGVGPDPQGSIYSQGSVIRNEADFYFSHWLNKGKTSPILLGCSEGFLVSEV